jgi:preprotein translocase subunit SecD
LRVVDAKCRKCAEYLLALDPSAPPVRLGPPILFGGDFERVVRMDSEGQPELLWDIQPRARKRAEERTAQNVGKPLALEIDGRIYSIANVQSAFSEGMQTTGLTAAEADAVFAAATAGPRRR